MDKLTGEHCQCAKWVITNGVPARCGECGKPVKQQSTPDRLLIAIDDMREFCTLSTYEEGIDEIKAGVTELMRENQVLKAKIEGMEGAAAIERLYAEDERNKDSEIS